MANPITTGLENILGINTTAGTQQLQQAMQALQSVGVPTAQQLDLPTLQKYVAAGVLTPAQYQAIQENPDVYSQMIQQSVSGTGTNAQTQALQELGNVVKAGGSTAINQANLLNNLNQVNQQQQAARAANLENAQERGVAGGGLEFLNNMVGNQQGAQNANANAVNAAANNAQLALQAMTQQGQLGGQLQSQENQMAQAKAAAAQQIAQYNSQLQSAANQYNTQNANAAQAANLQNAQNLTNANTQNANYVTQYNAQVPETVFQNQNQLAEEEAQQYGNQANLAEQQAQQGNQFIGGLLGAGATLGGDYLMGQALGGANGGVGTSNAGTGLQGGSAYGASPVAPGYAQNNQNLQQQTLNQGAYAHGGEARKPMDLHLKKGALHRELGISEDQNIPAKKIEKATHSDNELLRKRAQFAENAKKWKHKCQGGECMCQGGMCYAQGGETHDHAICMKMGGPVPGTPKVPGDSKKNDTIPAMLSPHEIVVPRSITQGPNPAGDAARFVSAVKANGGKPPMQNNAVPKPLNFADIIKQLEAQGVELKLGSK